MRNALDAGDAVCFINDWVGSVDLQVFGVRYAVMGEHSYPPRVVLKLGWFGAIEGVYSGREMSRRLRWDLRFRYLAGGLVPDFRTLNRFRVRHREAFEYLFRQTVRSALSAGLAKLGAVTEVQHPGGAFYVFAEVPQGVAASATEFVEKATERNVLVIPGNVFSRRDSHFRLSYAAPDDLLDEGLEILASLLSGHR